MTCRLRQIVMPPLATVLKGGSLQASHDVMDIGLAVSQTKTQKAESSSSYPVGQQSVNFCTAFLDKFYNIQL
jgi:hypothetical protein